MKDYSLSIFKDYFKVSSESPSGLVRIKNRVGKDIPEYSVGTKDFKNGNPTAWKLKFQGNKYCIHRIIWVLTHGSIDPTLVVDHLDGNPFNNLIGNLDLKTFSGNAMNKRQYGNNTTGFSGVILTNAGEGNFYYTAQWYEINGSRNRKCFSINKLGESTAKNLAITYREEQVRRLILEGADYTERHGV